MTLAVPSVLLRTRERELLLEKNGAEGVLLMAGEDGPRFIESKLLVGMFVLECVKLRRGRSVGGLGAGPGFMNWPGAYRLKNVSWNRFAHRLMEECTVRSMNPAQMSGQLSIGRGLVGNVSVLTQTAVNAPLPNRVGKVLNEKKLRSSSDNSSRCGSLRRSELDRLTTRSDPSQDCCGVGSDAGVS